MWKHYCKAPGDGQGAKHGYVCQQCKNKLANVSGSGFPKKAQSKWSGNGRTECGQITNCSCAFSLHENPVKPIYAGPKILLSGASGKGPWLDGSPRSHPFFSVES